MGLIGSAIGAVGSIFGGISASKAMKKAKQNVQEQIRKTKTGMTGVTTRTRHNVPTHSASLP